MAALKTRANNFSREELANLVDLVLENKAELFGGFSSKLTQLDKEAIWKEIAKVICRDHETLRRQGRCVQKMVHYLS